MEATVCLVLVEVGPSLPVSINVSTNKLLPPFDFGCTQRILWFSKIKPVGCGVAGAILQKASGLSIRPVRTKQAVFPDNLPSQANSLSPPVSC
jgi:hypothetical protein